jgi:hypothetical protein
MDLLSGNTAWSFPWWTIMVIIGVVNLSAALFILVKTVRKFRAVPASKEYALFLCTLGTIFTAIALYRSIFVSNYVDRLAWFDTILNSSFVIRCLALFAELSFISMIAVILLKIGKDLGFAADPKRINRVLAKTPFVSICCIFLAQFFAFGGLITQRELPFAIEETLWALTFLSITPLVILSLIRMKKQNFFPVKSQSDEEGAGITERKLNMDAQNLQNKKYKIFLIIMAIWCGGYLVFQLFYALPFMYYANLAGDAAKAIPTDALRIAITNFNVTRDLDTWGGIGFVIWHSGYFSVCSWMAIFFMTMHNAQYTKDT